MKIKKTQINVNNILFRTVFIAVFFITPFFAMAKQKINYSHSEANRIGISLGSNGWSTGLLIDYDRLGIIPHSNWSLGTELGFYEYGFILEPRAIWWEHINMSGFYVGPKIYLASVYSDEDHDDDFHKHHRHRTNGFHFGVGAEGGWSYRFPSKFDLGGGVELIATSWGLWAAIKISGGFVF